MKLLVQSKYEPRLAVTICFKSGPRIQQRTTVDSIVSRESKPRNSDFYLNDFLSTREYQTHGAHSVKFS